MREEDSRVNALSFMTEVMARDEEGVGRNWRIQKKGVKEVFFQFW